MPEDEKSEYPIMPNIVFDEQVEYDIKQNPLLVWEVLSKKIESNKPIPKWVLDYLCKTSKELLAIECTGQEAGKLVMKALKLKGKNFSQHSLRDRDEKIYSMVFEEQYKDKTKPISLEEALEGVLQQVNKLGHSLSFSSIKKIYYDQKMIDDVTQKQLREYENEAFST